MRIPGSYDRAMTDGGTAQGVDAQLEHAAQVRREAQALRHRLEAAAGYAQQTAARVTEARSRLADESEDVARLESFSWARISSTLRNNRADDLERETAERDAARYAVADAEARDAAARRDVAGLTAQLEALGDVDAAYTAALAAKEEWAVAHAPDVAARITELSTRRGVLLAEDAEAREAHAAGVEALQLLGEADRLLASAGSWATWDTFGGGGMLTDMMKYDKLDQVGRVLRAADIALSRFSRELADLRMGGVEAVGLDGMTRTFDVFFDNFFTDMRVRSRIQDAQHRVADALRRVERTLREVGERGRVIAAELEDLGRHREELLLG
jgi:hypothetical protein